MTSGRADKLAEQAALCERATPGPWVDASDVSRRQGYVKRVWNDEQGRRCTQYVAGEIKPADAAFIAAARTGWPDAIKALQRVLALAEEWSSTPPADVVGHDLADRLRRAVSGEDGSR